MRMNKNKFILTLLFISLFIIYIPFGFSPRLDNTNIVELSTIAQVDLTPPTIVFNFSNNTFTNSRIINITYNITDALGNNKTLRLYVNDIRNDTRDYINSFMQNMSLNFSVNITRNITLILEVNDTAGNVRNSTTRVIVIDTQAPIDVNASNKTRMGSTTITTGTDVNISVFVGDIYLSAGNFSHNASGNWVTLAPLTITGNNTYNYIIGAGNFTAKQVVGWKYNFTDRANNLLDPIFTFEVLAVSSTTTPSGGGGGGDASTVLSQLSKTNLLNPFGTLPIDGKCGVKEQLYQQKCYPCDPARGYLKFNPDDRSVLCVGCSDGFEFVDGKCQLLPPTSKTNNLNEIIDYYAKKISNQFNTDNLLVGYFVLVLISTTIINYSWKKLNKK